MVTDSLLIMSVCVAALVGFAMITITALAASNILALRIHKLERGSYVFQSTDAEELRREMQDTPRWIVWGFSICWAIALFVLVFYMFDPDARHDGFPYGLALVVASLFGYGAITFLRLVRLTRRCFKAFSHSTNRPLHGGA